MPIAEPTKADKEPLFSSFNPKGIFNPVCIGVGVSRGDIGYKTREDVLSQSAKKNTTSGQLNKSKTNTELKDNDGNMSDKIAFGIAAQMLKSPGNTLFTRV